jgi:hypothetical protein
MQPIVESHRVKRLARHQAIKALKDKKKVTVVKQQVQQQQNTTQMEQYALRIRKIEAQIKRVISERQRLEVQRQALIAEFTRQQAAFVSMLPSVNEKKPQQSILLALLSKSVDDFVHGELMLNFLSSSMIERNRRYVNLVQNINRTNFYIESYFQTEQNLMAQWRVEQAQMESVGRR